MAAPALSCRVGCERELDRSCAGGYASDRVGGCTAQEISDLTRVSQRLPLLADLYSQRRIASNILNAYLGPKTEPKVLAGQIRRGMAIRRVFAPKFQAGEIAVFIPWRGWQPRNLARAWGGAGAGGVMARWRRRR